MGIFYEENIARSFSGAVAYHSMDATKHYLTHYGNLLTLEFIAKNTKDGKERAQATSEIAICKRKLKYWTNHPNFELPFALRGVEELKRKWRK